MPWQRPDNRLGGGRRDTPRNKEVKATIAVLARAAGVQKQEAVDLWINFIFRRPPSHLKKDGSLRRTAPRTHNIDPDTSNLLKLVEDGLIGVAYDDDNAVVNVHAGKSWTTESESMTIVTIVDAFEGDEAAAG